MPNRMFKGAVPIGEAGCIVLVQVADSIASDIFLDANVTDREFSIAPVGFQDFQVASHAIEQWYQNGYVAYPYKFLGSYIYNDILLSPFTSQIGYYWLVPVSKIKSIVIVTQFDSDFVAQCYQIAQNISVAKSVTINSPS